VHPAIVNNTFPGKHEAKHFGCGGNVCIAPENCISTAALTSKPKCDRGLLFGARRSTMLQYDVTTKSTGQVAVSPLAALKWNNDHRQHHRSLALADDMDDFRSDFLTPSSLSPPTTHLYLRGNI
jgi:hypothetical protein